MKATHKIEYAYICEHCGHRNEGFFSISQRIDDTSTEFRGSTKITTTYSYEYKKDILRRKLQEEINDCSVEVSNGSYNSSRFNGECTHCGKRQSWELKASKSDIWQAPLGVLIFGAAISGIILYFSDIAAIISGGIVIILTLLFFIYGVREFKKIKADSKDVKQQLAPEINWGDTNKIY